MKCLILALMISCPGIDKPNDQAWQASGKAGYDLSAAEARRILGEPVKVHENKDSTASGGYYRRTTVYKAAALESGTKKEVNLYYMYENFPDASAPEKLYDGWKKSNQNLQGFEVMNDLGDEAFFQTDKSHFATLIILKGNKLVRLKINKLTSRSSLIELKKVAAEILARV